jgi:hypothetical protein
MDVWIFEPFFVHLPSFQKSNYNFVSTFTAAHKTGAHKYKINIWEKNGILDECAFCFGLVQFSLSLDIAMSGILNVAQ